ncbi:hypothetical protein G6N05_05465 [Flavobacterium sp. F372]|uniref:Uncharacterized protein n=1 Tax=Flavobacterium bernardetii TaxID=2813823 RepID=A0ABR7J1A1_9FLAO|nr:hypothetical protein [Flavobacterium bernardetii]MBC5835829.1 hypothetical protein [Flavobacterium bernardetii]NHF69559.1 hypothetical protein [Flavobacterium bernardetii]
MQNTDITSLEKKAGSAAASSLRAVFRTSIKSTFKRRTGKAEKSNVSAKYRDGNLDRLTLSSPHYSFKNHFGSSKTGTTPSVSRAGGSVKSFSRHIKGNTVTVNAFSRSGGSVSAHRKGIRYKAYGHLANAMRNAQPALEKLATDLTENRAVIVVSKIDF